MWMWRVFNGIQSLVTSYYFGVESTLLLPSGTTRSVLPRHANANDVLNVFLPPWTIQKRQICSKSAGIGEQPQPSQTTRHREDDYNHMISRVFVLSRNRQRPVIRRKDNVTAIADKSESETTPSVSPSSESLDVGGSATTRSTVRTSSSSGELTTTSFYAASASDVDETPPLTPTTFTTDSPSNVPAETDVTTTAAVIQTHASLAPSATSLPPSVDRPFSPSTTEPASTSLFSPASSKTSLPSVTSSTEANSSINILSTRGTSTTSTASSASPTSISSATASGSPATSLPPTTDITTTTSAPVPSSPSTGASSSKPTTDTPVPISSLCTHVLRTPSTISSSTYSTKTSYTCPTSQISTSYSKMTTTTLSSTTLSSTFIWTMPSPSSMSFAISRSSTSTSRTRTYSVFPSPQSSSSVTLSRPTSGFFTTSQPNTTPPIAPSPTSSNETSSTTSDTGSLRTDTSHVSAFARNTGAIIGVSLASTIALVCLVLLLFFTCRRYRRPRIYNGSTDNILTLAREVSWRRPVDGDDDSYMEKSRAFPPPGSLEHSVDTHDAFGSTSAGEHASTGHGSAESGNATMAIPMNTVFGGQPPIPGLDQSIQGGIALPPTAMIVPFLSEPHSVPRGPSNPYGHVRTGGTRSTASLTLARESISSREGTGSSSSTEETSTRPHGKRRSLLGPRPMGSKETRRHSSTPPTAFMGMRQPPFDYERQLQTPEQSDRMSVKSFISRLRNGRRTSAQSMSTIRGPSLSQTRQGDVSGPSSVGVFSPSLLNPPIMVISPHPVLTFPRGVTGNSYSPLESQAGDGPQDGPSRSPVLWPPATLPPSPSPTDNSSLAEGLLHPKLSLAQGQSQQASLTSLRDHEDYTRPINGLVNNHLQSTTTFDTQDTSESGGGKDSIKS